jgi:DDE superfamily endonuclease
VLADPGYEGAGHGVHVPVKKPAGSKELDIDTRARNALLRPVRCLGERGFALLTQRWRTLQRVTGSPGEFGPIARAALVLVLYEDDHVKAAGKTSMSFDTIAVCLRIVSTQPSRRLHTIRLRSLGVRSWGFEGWSSAQRR